MKIKKQKQKVKQESPYDFKLSPGCLGCLDALDAWMPWMPGCLTQKNGLVH